MEKTLTGDCRGNWGDRGGTRSSSGRLRELGYGGGGSRFAGHAGNGVCQYIHNTDAGGGQVHMRGARTLWDGREGD